MSSPNLSDKQWQRVRELFAEVPEHESAAAREARLTALSTEDSPVRAELERLLALDAGDAHAPGVRTDDWLEQGAPEAAVRAALDDRHEPPQTVGPYRILSTLGVGGHATVFLAEQDEPSRRVALKVLRHGLDAASAHQRFTYEAELLASLRHPGIAQVYAVGTDSIQPFGRRVPYFAMELVEGAKSLTAYVRDTALDLPATLELFVRVCGAVHAGHQRGVVHRDLKPGNILVDAAGHPKVIDFGIARTLTALDDRAAHTLPGELLGTLPYMSPEQVAGDPREVDLRVDVHALGVVLFELLTGTQPLAAAAAGRSLTEAITEIRDGDVPRASKCPGPFRNDTRTSELDWVIHCALAKRPEARYASVNELASDVQRVLDQQPIQARAPSTRYFAAKFIRRHRTGVLAATAALVTATAALGFVLHGAWQVRQAERQTRASLAAAEREVETRRVVDDFLRDLLLAPNPYVDGRDVRVLDLLDRAADGAEDLHPNRPELAAALGQTLGRTYLGLGEASAARPHLERAYREARVAWGPDDSRSLDIAHQLADATMRDGELDTAARLLDDLLERRIRTLGERHTETASCLALAGHLAFRRDDLGRAAEHFEAARRIHLDATGPGSRMSVTVSAALGTVLDSLGRDRQARDMLELAVEAGTVELGSDHPSVLTAVNNLATLRLSTGDHAGAVTMFERILAAQEASLGELHDDVLLTINNLAGARQKLGEFAAAAADYRELLARRESAGKRRAVRTMICLGNLGVCLESQDELEAADARFTECLELAAELGIPATHWLHAAYRKGHAVVRRKQGHLAESESMLRACLAVFDSSSERDHSARRRSALQALADTLLAQGKDVEAQAIQNELTRD